MAIAQLSFSSRIRPAALQDIPTIRELAENTWPATYGAILSPEQLSYMMDMMYSPESLRKQMEGGHRFWIAEEESKAVAFAAMNEPEPSVVKLQKIYVLPSQQGHGTGKRLLHFVLEEAARSGASVLRLNVNRHNKAKDFYERMGFAVTKEEKIDIGRGYVMDDYVMEKELSTAGNRMER